MPVNTPAIKVNNVKRLGGQVELVGESYQETQSYAQVRQERGTQHPLRLAALSGDHCVVNGPSC
jgi:threonine dehydratase